SLLCPLCLFSQFYTKIDFLENFATEPVVVFTVVPAVFDMVAAFPAVVSQSTFGQAMAHVQSFLPLASSGMDWLVPALVGAVFGTAHYLLLQRAKTSTGMEVPMKR
uniref:branched-chain amino acid transport system II carrier protein n=1 Tax=Liquorilactobacillus uvarum TaxID=303240 RepID=UPI00288B00C1